MCLNCEVKYVFNGKYLIMVDSIGDVSVCMHLCQEIRFLWLENVDFLSVGLSNTIVAHVSTTNVFYSSPAFQKCIVLILLVL